MHVSFNEMPGTARVWIYQADRVITEEEVSIIQEQLRAFTGQWAAHGAGLRSSFDICYNHFIIIAVDEHHHQASGCSIDASVSVMKALEKSLDIQFFDRSKVAFLIDGEIILRSLQDLKQNHGDALIDEDTFTFNNLVSTKSAMEDKWLIPVGLSWVSKYFKTAQLK